jgi:hypothetical protein
LGKNALIALILPRKKRPFCQGFKRKCALTKSKGAFLLFKFWLYVQGAAVLFANEWVQGAQRRWISPREQKTHKLQNEKSLSEERKGGAQAMKSERRPPELLAPCALAHNERLSAARWVGFPSAAPQRI